MKQKKHIEVEARFINIDIDDLKQRLKEVGAKDLGESLLKETIFYDKTLKWRDQAKFVRLRKNNKEVSLTYKHHKTSTIQGAEEIEVIVNDYRKMVDLLKRINLIAFREQEKRRHSYVLGSVQVDIDTWPQVPPYVEIEGKTVEDVKRVAKIINLNWKEAIFEDAKLIIEKYYKIPVSKLTSFTFSSVS